ELEQQVKNKRAMLKAVADTEITWRQDAVDADIASDVEKADLAAWKKYRVMLMRVDTSKPEWPEKPE
ncbi:tail fiber assembly protein, partial [Buttiauxella gaviniae]